MILFPLIFEDRISGLVHQLQLWLPGDYSVLGVGLKGS